MTHASLGLDIIIMIHDKSYEKRLDNEQLKNRQLTCDRFCFQLHLMIFRNKETNYFDLMTLMMLVINLSLINDLTKQRLINHKP